MTSHPRSPAPTRPSARWVGLLVGLTVVAAAVGVLTKQWCRVNGWAAPGVHAHMCYSDFAQLFPTRGLSDGHFPFYTPLPPEQWMEYPALLAVVAGVTAEAALVDLALGRAVERQPHLLEIEDGVDGFLRHHLGGVLVHEVVTALDGVERVPLPVVLLDVGEGRAHAALGRAGVGTRGVDLGEDGGVRALTGLDGRAHARAAGADDHHVVLVHLHSGLSFWVSVTRRPLGPAAPQGERFRGQPQKAGEPSSRAPEASTMQGSKVKITRVPRMMITAVAMYRIIVSQKRALPRRV